MSSAILIVCAALVFTKLLDVLSTLKNIKGIQHEANPIARSFMYRWGVRKAVWAIFGLAVAISITASVIAINSPLWLQLGFLLYGSFVAIVQASVAYANHNHTQNALTRVASRLLTRTSWFLWGRGK